MKPTAPDQDLDFIIYYQTKRTAALILKNSHNEQYNPLQKANVVYHFTRPSEGSHLRSTYIGMTTTKLLRRLTCHLQPGASSERTQSEHNTTLTRKVLVDNTNFLESTTDQIRLQILEAMLIRKDPFLNIQNNDFVSVPTL